MRLISHRGNLNGPNPERENTPEYIQEALDAGYEVEIDVWRVRPGQWFLGHDGPELEVDTNFIFKKGLVVHCKNLYALGDLICSPEVECFFHDQDDYTLTSKNAIWTFPGRPAAPQSILVHPETFGGWENDVAGLCSDWITRYEQLRNV